MTRGVELLCRRAYGSLARLVIQKQLALDAVCRLEDGPHVLLVHVKQHDDEFPSVRTGLNAVCLDDRRRELCGLEVGVAAEAFLSGAKVYCVARIDLEYISRVELPVDGVGDGSDLELARLADVHRVDHEPDRFGTGHDGAG